MIQKVKLSRFIFGCILILIITSGLYIHAKNEVWQKVLYFTAIAMCSIVLLGLKHYILTTYKEGNGWGCALVVGLACALTYFCISYFYVTYPIKVSLWATFIWNLTCLVIATPGFRTASRKGLFDFEI